MRRGRLKVVSDGRFETTQVYVVTQDGEEIELPVNAVTVRVDAGEAFLVDLTAYAVEIDVGEFPIFHVEKRIRARSSSPSIPAVYPNLEMVPPSDRVRAVRWAVSFREPIAKIFTSEIEIPEQPA